MSKLEGFIKEKCLNGVEHKYVGEICKIEKGVQLNKDSLKKEGLYPVINGGVSPSGYWDEYNFNANLITISQGGASAGYVNFINTPFWAGAHCYVICECVDSVLYRYLYHFIKMKQVDLMQSQVGAGIPSISLKSISSLEIPIPPLEIQQEIVRILDKLTELETGLQAELDARKKQFEYYKEKLISDAKDVEVKTIEEIATEIYRGVGIKRDETTPTGFPCVRYGEIYTSYNIIFNKCVSFTKEDIVSSPKYFEHGDILFAITGESIEDIAKSIAYLGHEKCMCGGDIVVMKHCQEPRYISYALSTYDAIVQKGKGKVKSKVVHSSIPAIKKIRIPVPTLDEQSRIADKLDVFLTLIYDESKGILAEIDVRHKQYEYYRDKLLTFERKVV